MKEGDSILVNLTEDGSNLSLDTQVPDRQLFQRASTPSKKD